MVSWLCTVRTDTAHVLGLNLVWSVEWFLWTIEIWDCRNSVGLQLPACSLCGLTCYTEDAGGGGGGGGGDTHNVHHSLN